jgi:fatty acid desaturase
MWLEVMLRRLARVGGSGNCLGPSLNAVQRLSQPVSLLSRSSESSRSISLPNRYPTKAELLRVLPTELMDFHPLKAWGSLGLSVGLSVLGYGIGTQIPLQIWAFPLWIIYGIITGTVAMGCWVIAHECGHNAFHPNRRLEGAIGFVLHSLLLVPYFTWARSHAVHHAHCNHLEEGETHVPPRAESHSGRITESLRVRLGLPLFGCVSLFSHLVIGWPLYLFLGTTGGEVYGRPTSHFWNGSMFAQGKRPLFPRPFRGLMMRSNLGILLVLLALAWLSFEFSIARVLCVYGLPYIVINFWLVTYTWLQHTDVVIPHFSSEHWTWAKGALQTVDRPYGPLLNLLHHGIGSTHVCHHVNSRIPHYNAWRGNALLKRHFPELVRYDHTPIHQALWRIACRCAAVRRCSRDGAYYY